jgi:anaerobic selenocysteine-containing dehydrogenase
MSMDKKRTLTFCQHCHMKCRLHVTTSDGVIESIKNGMGVADCKGVCAPELLYHPDRILHPLKRAGKRGNGQWTRISWEEALDLMSSRFGEIKRRFGPEAIATILGCGHKQMAYYATFLFGHILGAPNILDINRQCNVPTLIGEITTFGQSLLQEPGPDFLRSRCILIWGANPRHTRPALERDICEAAKSGAKIIVIDPRPPERLDQRIRPAELWLRVKPGTDAILALAMIRVVIEEGLYNRDFVNEWCVGLDQLRRHVKRYSLEEAERITWVPKDMIASAARLFTQTRPSCLHTRLGASAQHINATQTARAIAIFAALAGNIDIPGGNLMVDLGSYRHQRSIAQMPLFQEGVEKKRYGAEAYPFICAPKGGLNFFSSLRRSHGPDCVEAMLDGLIKAFYVPGCNFVVSEGDSKRVWDALNRLEFLVVAELFMTPTAELADLVLPAAHFLETELPMQAFQRMGPRIYNYILAARKIVEPRGECWDDRKIVFELAKRMNIRIPWKSVEEFNDWTLEPLGVTFRDLLSRRSQQLSFPIKYEKYKEHGFKTPSGKLELFSVSLQELGYEPLPDFQEPSTGLKAEYDEDDFPLILITHRNVSYMHSEFRQIPSLRGACTEPLIEINPLTAKNLGIGERDSLYVERPGFKWRVTGRAKLVPELHPRVVSCLSHWWFPEKQGPEHGCFESNINTIISHGDPYDPVTGAHQGRALACRIGKAP